MLRAIIAWRIGTIEKSMSEPLDYLRHILRVTLRGFFAFLRLTSYAAYRRRLPREPFHIVRIVATKHEDCGPCVQTVVTAARKDGVPAEIVRAALDGKLEALPDALRETYEFTDAVIRATYQEAELRDRLRARWGEEALVELALIISACRAYPITKRVLGHAQSCSRVVVDV